MKRRIMLVLLSVLLCLPSFSSAVSLPVSADNSAPAGEKLQTEGMSLIAEEGGLAFYADSKTGEILLHDKNKNTFWRSNPAIAENDTRISGGQKRLMSAQIEILYYDANNTEQERNGYVASVAKGGLTAKLSDGRAVMTYNFPDDGISVSVEYRLCDGYLSVTVPKDQIKEAEGSRLVEVSVLPYFGCGNYDDNGFIFLPDGSGTVIEMNNGRSAGAAVKQRVYGDDLVVADERRTESKQNMNFPLIGINKNSSGIIAVADSGEACSYINAYTAGMKKNYNCAYFSFEYRSTGTVVLDSSSSKAKTVKKIADEPISTSFSMRYYPVADSGSYVDMADSYRNYLIAEKGFEKSNELSEVLPFYVNAYGAVQKKGTFLYIPMTVTVPLTTYDQAGELMKRLSESGIKNIVFSYIGWEKAGVSGKLPTAGKYERKLGEKKDFEKLCGTAEKLGVTFLPDVNTVELKKSGNGYSKNNSAAATLDGTPGLQYSYNLYSGLKDTSLAPFYLLAPSKMASVVEKFFSKYKMDIPGISMNKAGYMLYSDHHKEPYDRQRSLSAVTESLKTAKKSGVLLTKSAFSYAAAYSDYIAEAPVSDSGFDITDYSVPFYQILMCGYKSCSVGAVNLSGGTQKSLLKALETGSALAYTFTSQNSEKTENTYLAEIYNSDYRPWLETAAEQYETVSGIYKKIAGNTIVGHRRITEEVFETEFSSGVKIRVNYSGEDYSDASGTVKAENYLVIE